MSRNVSDAVRRQNLGTLLRLVHVGGPASRSALARRMGVNRSTIMALTSELTSAGLVSEETPTRNAETGRAGRPSIVVRPSGERVYVLAFDVAVDRLVAARVGLGGVVLDRRVAVRRRAGADLDDVVEVLAGFGRSLYDPDATCVGVGASYCGMVRPADGMVHFAPDTGWVDQAFGTSLARALGLGLPVAVGNEAHLGARAEHLRGAGTGFRNLVYLHGDVGVGGGIIVGGRLLDGEAGYGCELGHIVVNPVDGRACNCGSHGCLEAEVGERALLDLAGRPSHLYGRAAVRSVVEATDPQARDAVRRIGDWLGIGVANLINLFNPGVVIFGGMLRDVYPAAAREIRARIAANVLAVSRGATLCVSALGDDACLIGASELAFSTLISDPVSPPGVGQRSGGSSRRAAR